MSSTCDSDNLGHLLLLKKNKIIIIIIIIIFYFFSTIFSQKIGQKNKF